MDVKEENQLEVSTMPNIVANSPIIVDMGSSRIKFGRAGQVKPSFIASSFFVVDGRTGKYKLSSDGNFSQMASNSKAKAYSLVHVDEEKCSTVTNMDAFSAFLQETQPVLQNKSIGYMPIEVPMLISERNMTRKSNRKEVVETLFEKHSVPNLFFAKCATLAAYGMGKTTALVVDAGFSSIEISCVNAGLVLEETKKYSEFGSYQLCYHISQHLKAKYKYFTGTSVINGIGESNVRKLRELYKCNDLLMNYMDINYTDYSMQQKHVQNEDQFYYLPDGSSISSVQTRRLSDDVLSLIFGDKKRSTATIQELVAESGQLAGSSELKRLLFGNILCSGGLANKKYFSSKLNAEIGYLKQGKYQGLIPDYNVITHSISQLIGKDFDIGTLSWTGGSIVGSLSSFNDFTVSRELYNEGGMLAFESRCP